MTAIGVTVPPFPEDYRASGLLLHVTSLPSQYGIGDFGPNAISWIDRLAQAGQSCWQILPLGPTSVGNSPYTPLSSFAANPLLISPDWLIEDGLLRANDVKHEDFAAEAVDFDQVSSYKRRLLETACANFKAGARPDLRAPHEKFCTAESEWLDDYALFMVLKTKFQDASYLDWPANLIERKPQAIAKIRRECANQLEQVRFGQFLLFRQLSRLKAYAQEKGVALVGDMPIFVSGDSSDVWANPRIFLLNEHRRPQFVAGVPPDYFSADGQLWGNPLYNWDNLHATGHHWWIERLRFLLNYADFIRLDHFRAFVAAWHVPANAVTAKSGEWSPGPGAEFLTAVEQQLGSLPLIAEDLGMITPDVYKLRDQFHLPGMRILQFAFDGHADDPYLPENFVTNTIVYTGTHDNPTTLGWFEELPADERDRAVKYLESQGIKDDEPARSLMELAWSSPAALAIAPLQDLLNLGKSARMNVPGQPKGNWEWRCTETILSASAFDWLGELTKDTKRFRAATVAEGTAVKAASEN